MRMRHVVLAGIVALAVVAGGRSTLRGDPLPASSLNWIFDGPVRGTARLGDTLYVGGDFTRVAPSSAAIGSAYAVSTSTGALVPGVFPRVDGTVLAIEPDGAGGYYLGGDFQIPGAPQPTRLARVRPDGTFDPAFAPVIARAIVSLARVGGVLYFVQAASFGVGPQPGSARWTRRPERAWRGSHRCLPDSGPRCWRRRRHGVVIGGQELIAPIVDVRDRHLRPDERRHYLVSGCRRWSGHAVQCVDAPRRGSAGARRALAGAGVARRGDRRRSTPAGIHR